MNPNEIKKAKKFLKIAKDLEANATINRQTVVVILDYINQLEAENKGFKSDVITLKHLNGHLKTKYDEIMALSKRLMQKLIKAREQLKTARLEVRENLVNSLKGKVRRPFVNYCEPVVLVSDIDNLLKDKDGEN